MRFSHLVDGAQYDLESGFLLPCYLRSKWDSAMRWNHE